MKIVIIGAGAMGSLYGARLSTVPTNEVYLLDVWEDHVNAINERGLLVQEGEDFVKYDKVKASSDAQSIGVCDLAIIFVKSTLTSIAVKSNKAVFGPETIALTLQNGLGNIELISEEVKEENIIAGTTAHGACWTRKDPMPERKNHNRELDGSRSERIEKLAQNFNEAILETEISSMCSD